MIPNSLAETFAVLECLMNRNSGQQDGVKRVSGVRGPYELGRNRLGNCNRQTQGKDGALVDLACD